MSSFFRPRLSRFLVTFFFSRHRVIYECPNSPRHDDMRGGYLLVETPMFQPSSPFNGYVRFSLSGDACIYSFLFSRPGVRTECLPLLKVYPEPRFPLILLLLRRASVTSPESFFPFTLSFFLPVSPKEGNFFGISHRGIPLFFMSWTVTISKKIFARCQHLLLSG